MTNNNIRPVTTQESITFGMAYNNAVQIMTTLGKSEHYFVSEEFEGYVEKLYNSLLKAKGLVFPAEKKEFKF